MRRVLSALFLIAVLASPAGGQTSRAPAPERPAAPSSAAAIIPPPLPALASPRLERDPQACMAACRKTYYFCRANTDDDSCPGEWARCDARCKATFVRATP